MSNKSLNNGLVWMPYIPVQITPKISEVSPGILKSRYATKIVNSSYYGVFGNGDWSFGKNQTRKSKIENIFKIENPTE